MQYIKVTNDKWIALDEETNQSTVYSKEQLQKEINEAEKRLEEIPEPLSDEKLLEWAKKNYPQMNYMNEISYLNNIISTNNNLLENFNG